MSEVLRTKVLSGSTPTPTLPLPPTLTGAEGTAEEPEQAGEEGRCQRRRCHRPGLERAQAAGQGRDQGGAAAGAAVRFTWLGDEM